MYLPRSATQLCATIYKSRLALSAGVRACASREDATETGTGAVRLPLPTRSLPTKGGVLARVRVQVEGRIRVRVRVGPGPIYQIGNLTKMCLRRRRFGID